MKIDFVGKYNIWDLKKVSYINEYVLSQLPPSSSIELDVRGCTFDYLSTGELIKKVVAYLDKKVIEGSQYRQLIITVEIGSSEVTIADFFGNLVVEEKSDKHLDEIIEDWCIKNRIHIIFQKDMGDLILPEKMEILAEYGKH